MQKRLIVIVGPTAVGKTSLAIQLAGEFRTEILSADSRQIFRELVIGTDKPSAAELAAVPHHFVGTKSIHEEYTAGQYGRDALGLLDQLFEKYDTVILSGGSGLYVKAVCEGFDEMPVIAPGIREAIMAEYEEKGISWLQQQVQKSDPDYFMTVDRRNPHRLVRALELHRATGKTQELLRLKKNHDRPFTSVKIGLELDRTQLNERIEQRMDRMIDSGLFDEAAGLLKWKNLNALQTVGYQEIFGFLDGIYDRIEAVRLLKRNSRHYAKRQMTWFRRDPSIKWFAPGQFQEILTFVQNAISHEQ